MSLRKLTGIATIIFALVMGCSGKYGNFKTQSASDSKVTQQELFDNWSDYDIWLNYRPKECYRTSTALAGSRHCF